MSNEITEVLRFHAGRYPDMRPCDAVKLLYQNEFGSGHMLPDEPVCVRRISTERHGLPSGGYPSEPVGNGLARLYLQEANRLCLSSRSVGRMFRAASLRESGSRTAFVEKLWILRRMTEEGQLPFAKEELDEYLRGYIADGCPAVSHSETYRERYAPAYRLIPERLVRLLPVVRRVDGLLSTQGRAVVVLDGRCASGKSSAAELLAPLWNAPVVHMDDFFLPKSLRTPERLAEPGGNVHYERFREEVVLPLSEDRPFSYRVFSCRTGDYSGTREIPRSEVVIVEGAYSLHPYFGSYEDAAFFFDINPEEQLRRIRRRDGEQALAAFRDRWIPMENRYIREYRIDSAERID